MPELTADRTAAEWTTTATGGETLYCRLTRPLPRAWRLQVAVDPTDLDGAGAAQQLAEALGEDLPEAPAPVELDAGGTVRAGDGVVRIDDERLAFEQAGRRMVLDALDRPDGAWRVGGPLEPGERLWGTGERFNALDQRGRDVTLWAEDRWLQTEGNSYVPIPFLLSSRGYGLLVNRYEKMRLDLGASDPGRWALRDLQAPLDLYVFLAASPGEILADLTALCGRPPMPPAWAFGMLVSRHGRTKEFASADGVLAMADAMDRLDLPWSGAIIEGWPTYARDRYGELKRLADALHARGKTVLVYEACGRVQDKLTGALPDMERFLVRDREGNTALRESEHYNPADAPTRKTSRFLDITSPDARRAWEDRVWRPLLADVGVDGAKIDFCEQFPEDDTLQLADGRAPQGMHHLFPTVYNAMMHDLFQRYRPSGGLCWSRGGGIGAGRYPFLWCGDQPRAFDGLRAMLLAALTAGASGVPFMGHDMAGYVPAREPEGNPEDEVFVRGTQMAAFWPMMSTHGTVTRPYDFPAPIVDLYRRWTKIHEALLPYIREQAAACCETGMPFVRALCLAFPDDPTACGVEDQFLMGADLLVAPVLERADRRPVYLPAGAWRDVNTGAVLDGPAHLAASPAPLETIPVFAAETPTSAVLADCLAAVRSLLAG
ncbi:MAG: TIM-barrel domain-containing protein [Planctomycetota bacterium]